MSVPALKSNPSMAHAPIVFISSTSEDLKEYRQQAAKAARGMGFFPLMMEDFPANGRGPSLDECLREVERAELVIAIVAHRYGWFPTTRVSATPRASPGLSVSTPGTSRKKKFWPL